MKVLHLIGNLNIGGAERLLVSLIPEIRRHGIISDVAVISGEKTIISELLTKEKVNIIEIGNKNAYGLKAIIQLHKLFKNYDIIHTHTTPAQLLARITSIGTKYKLVTTEHSTNNNRRGKILGKIFDKWLFKRYNMIIGCSNDVSKGLCHQIGETRKVVTIPNGLNIKTFSEARPILYPKGQTEVTVVMVGRFNYPKDQSTVIKALSLLPNNYKVIFIGDGEEIERCKSLVKELALQQRVIFLGIRSNVANWLKIADIFVLSSHWEGLPLSILEAMATPLPVIATNTKGITEIVNNVGLLFEKENFRDLGRQILKLGEDKSLRDFYRNKSQTYINDYSISKMADSYIKIYQKVLEQSEIVNNIHLS